MDAFNNYYHNPYVYGNPYQNNFYATSYQPDSFQPPAMDSTLTPDEIKILKSEKPDDELFNLNINDKDVLRAICNHKENGRDVVQELKDGSGRVWCPICGAKWDPREADRDEVQTAVNTLYNHMQNAKWCGMYPIKVGREYFTMIPLLEKFPELYEYGVKHWNHIFNQRGYNIGNGSSIQYQYNSLFNNNRMYNPYAYGGYATPYQPQPYTSPYNAMNQPVGTPANPNVNPMQANVTNGQPQATQPVAPPPTQGYVAPPPTPPNMVYGVGYGYNPNYGAAPAPNTQQGYPQPGYGGYAQPYAPNFAPPQPQAPVAPQQAPQQGQPAASAAPQSQAAPAAPQADQQTTNVKIDL